MSTSTIEDTFIQKLSLVNGLADCANFAIQSQLAQYDGMPKQEENKLIAAINLLAETVEANGLARLAQGVEPAYHNRQHFIEVLVALMMLLEAHDGKAGRNQGRLDLKQRLLLLAAAIGHDYLHDGGVDQSLADAEHLSATATKNILLEAGIGERDAEYVYGLIMATARAELVENHSIVKAHPNKLDADLLAKLLISEADIFASLLPNYGITCGEKLAKELDRAGMSNAFIIASPQGRQTFLKHSFISSPHAKALGLDVLVEQQIQ